MNVMKLVKSVQVLTKMNAHYAIIIMMEDSLSKKEMNAFSNAIVIFLEINKIEKLSLL